MSIAHVQDAAIGAVSNGASQQSGAFGANPTVGNYVVAYAWGWADTAHHHPTACVFTDTGGNTYTVPAGVFRDQASDLWCAAAYAPVATGGASFKVTATPTGSGGTYNGSVVVCAAEFSGVASSSPLDGSAAGATGTSTTVAPGSMTLTAGSLVVAVGTDDNSTYGGSTPTGFTRVGFQNNGSSFQVGEAVYAIGPTSPANPSRTITSAKWAAAQFALLAAGGGGGTTQPTLSMLGCGP